jgi:restriction endonuclease Mrr
MRPSHDKQIYRATQERNLRIDSERLERTRESFSRRSGYLTVGEWASRLKMRSSTLISHFSKAGVKGLTPKHVLDSSHTEALLAYVRGAQDTTTTEVYCDDRMLEQKLVVVQSLNRHLLEQLSRTPKLMHQLDPRKFEEVVAELLESQGCKVQLTKRTRDGGYDIFGSIATGPTDFVFLAECKRYAPENKVGVELVRNLYGVTEIQKANQGLLITSSSFTRDAVEEKIRIGPRIELKDFEDLKVWLDHYKTK